jgi:hypothetical protein
MTAAAAGEDHSPCAVEQRRRDGVGSKRQPAARRRHNHQQQRAGSARSRRVSRIGAGRDLTVTGPTSPAGSAESP